MTLPIARLALGDLEHELGLTRKVLERVPEEHLDWRPHAKSGTLGELAAHLANLPFFGTAILTTEEFDLERTPKLDRPTSREGLVQLFDRQSGDLRAAMAATSDDALLKQWTLRMGDHVIMQMPRAAAVRSMAVSHTVHHRGQLTVYYRLVGTPVPGLYGPSADER
jgi:uncharacterized damage-inducible protein DinB